MLKIFIILQYQEEKVGAQDVDSAEMLAIKKDRKIIVDSNTFSNVIRLMVFLITEKLVNFTSVHFVSAKYYIILNMAIRNLKLTNLPLSPGFLSMNLKCKMDALFTKEFAASIEKM